MNAQKNLICQDVIELITEYAVNECRDCKKNNCRYHYHLKKKYCWEGIEPPRLCPRCTTNYIYSYNRLNAPEWDYSKPTGGRLYRPRDYEKIRITSTKELFNILMKYKIQ